VRAITNLIGNAVATVAIARWDGALDLAQARAVLAGKAPEAISSEFASVVPPRDE